MARVYASFVMGDFCGRDSLKCRWCYRDHKTTFCWQSSFMGLRFQQRCFTDCGETWVWYIFCAILRRYTICWKFI